MTNKDKIYKKVQDLFPSSLGEGDVVEYGSHTLQGIVLYILKNKKKIVLWDIGVNGSWDRGVYKSFLIHKNKVKLIRKRITLPMVLEAMTPSNYYINSNGTFYKRIFNDNEGTMVDTEIRWISRKNGKDCNLYDQSIDLIKLVWEVLK